MADGSRSQIMQRKNRIEELIKSAYSNKHHLSHFPNFQHYDNNGLSVFLESGRGDKLSSSLKQFIQNLLKDYIIAVAFKTPSHMMGLISILLHYKYATKNMC
uniref:N-alpha-acetyltransferase 40 isoform X2 n=1 Tax=Tanacetum cinerariifolium TaxID=118510 RepID=A0A6L2L575_TANCI|nr:N-alpha-acetyltransferase 40 isoform X2 [Tanacetum cinerariifolium]